MRALYRLYMSVIERTSRYHEGYHDRLLVNKPDVFYFKTIIINYLEAILKTRQTATVIQISCSHAISKYPI